MPVSVTNWLLYFCVCMLGPAVFAYFCGNINGAILISKYIFHEDVRTKGSGNAGLTNFCRNYGVKYAALVIVLDALKMVAAVIAACLLMGWTVEAKGGKGILSCGTLLWMLDWRVALVAWGTFLLLAVFTRYVSLGSVMCALTTPVTMVLFYPGHWVALGLMTLTAALVVWAHRGNISRLLKGTESKFSFKKE